MKDYRPVGQAPKEVLARRSGQASHKHVLSTKILGGAIS
jgi:hypothetical protein